MRNSEFDSSSVIPGMLQRQLHDSKILCFIFLFLETLL